MRIAICNDNKLCREQLFEIANAYREQKQPDAIISVYESAWALMQDVLSFGAFDIYILDIIMPGCSGIQLGKDLRRADPDGKILHLTSSAEYALESCRVKAFDITSILDFFLGNTYIFMAVSRLILCPLVALAVWKWVRTSYMELQNHVQKGRYIFAAIALIFYILMSMAAILHSFIQYI